MSGALIDTESDPGSYADALAHSVHIRVDNHIPRSDPTANLPGPVFPTPHAGPGSSDHRSFHERTSTHSQEQHHA